MNPDVHTPDEGVQATGPAAASWLLRGRPQRQTALERHLLSPEDNPDHRALLALEAELAEERERLAAVEAQLAAQSAALARLSGEPVPVARRPGDPAPRHVELWRRDPTTCPEYWLCHCEGFTVEARERTIGVVEEVRYASRHDCPDELVLRVGRLRQRLFAVAVDEVEALDAREQRVVLRRDPRLRPGGLPLRVRAADAVRSRARRLQRPHARPA
jgi:hypothetical protein